MQKPSFSQGKPHHVVFFLTALLIIAADQLSKIWIRSNLAVGESLFDIGILGIVRVPPNTGAAFGLFQGQSFTLTIVASVAVAIILVWALFLYRRFPLFNSTQSRIALGLILGGTMGNLIDRLNPDLGGVTDFISIGIWPTFNIADSAATIGAIMLAYYLIRAVRVERR